jgi:hypothetical protein
MRMIPIPPEAQGEDQAAEDWFNANAQMCDWKDSPDTVLGHVDHLLKSHGLEVVLFHSGDDSYQFQVLPIAPPEKTHG